jgi:SAM-dependent methyltransferase
MDKQNNTRRLTDPVLEWETKYIESKILPRHQSLLKRLFSIAENLIDTATHPQSVRSVPDILRCIKHLIDDDHIGKQVAVLGCGPKPDTIRDLVLMGYDVVGIEPVAEAVRHATSYLEGTASVVQGTAERIPVEDGSQTLVLMENVLEHVDSVPKSLAEVYRVLKPGGVLFVRTTNRMRFSLTGINWEYTVRFFNWFPRMIKESYIFSQLHYHPELARYSPRPAVHWFSFSDLCTYGRDVGFARFYSPFDLLYLTRCGETTGVRFRFWHWLHCHPIFRALMISQMNGDVFMWKRSG